MGLEILLVVHYSITYFIKRAGILYLSCLDQYITFLKFLADDGTIQSGMQRLQEAKNHSQEVCLSCGV